jgi:hypothetical protein
MSNEDAFEHPRRKASAKAQGYVDDAQAKRFPSPDPIGTAPREAERILLLFCPEQGGWHSGLWHHGEWTDALTGEKHVKPTHWMDVPPEPVNV